ncbi:hypothetical protein [Methylobacterium indicum]|uniref:Uncharacterized protein n=1 Tax=Methylobacterium indicum TaxID=1775910 RepID=A0A8H9C5G1_9HYPH|nr:hypothetical protein [Methylobacterium indicum]BCM83016.1 hypothetical protein mvi_14770 [Methylobacterium indicum]
MAGSEASGVEAGDGLARDYAAARHEAELLAGGTGDLAQRTLAYHHLFRHSGGGHAFPLLAAHGALWARGYFAWGGRAGAALSLAALHRPDLRRARLAGLAGFAEAFREINRRVFVEVYAGYRFTLAHGERAGAEAHLDPGLLDALNRCHRAGRRMRSLNPGERAYLFEACFRWEQRAVVAPAVAAAAAGFAWEPVRRLALRPSIRFAYMPRRETLHFADFADTDERIEKGLRAFAIAEAVGWGTVEARLSRYGALPAGFFAAAGTAFHATRARLLAGEPGPQRLPQPA